ncbi:unnamed protein product [Phyllotreta striolata]|uniref:ISXO2-like transposase domain-containing protein n=1 Tax=Phyllotreta striolata TaxID=444603 RepID=A0A9N9TJM7_PHYSR|nr:unnamed protein product [Phyllotreta striolata]
MRIGLTTLKLESRKEKKFNRKSKKINRKYKKSNRKSKKINRKYKKNNRKSKTINRKYKKSNRKSKKINRKYRKVNRKSKKINSKFRKFKRTTSKSNWKKKEMPKHILKKGDQKKSCPKEYAYHTENPNREKSLINIGAVWGTLPTGNTYSHMSEMLASIDVPTMPSNMFYQMENNLGKSWEVSLTNSMKRAGEKEKQIAIEKQQYCKNGVPWITVYVDGSWSKRSYGTNYNALSGIVAIIGKNTGQLLFTAVRNKFCSVCARAENSCRTTEKHVCYKNWNQSAPAMEAHMVVQGEEMHGQRYMKFIADGNSSVYKHITEKVTYGTDVKKIECTNHALKNYGKRLRDIKKDTTIDLASKKLLTEKKMKLLLKRAKTSIYEHAKKEEPRFNQGKRLNLIQRGSYQRRVQLSGLRYNGKTEWHTSPYKHATGNSPGQYFKMFLNRQVNSAKKKKTCRKRLFDEKSNNATKTTKKIKIMSNNTDYGPKADQFEDPSMIQQEVEEIIQGLHVTENDRDRIQVSSIGQFGNEVYESERKHRLTASTFGSVVKRRKHTPCHVLVRSVLKPTGCMTDAMEYGILREKVAKGIFEKTQNLPVADSGLWIDIHNSYLAASPDELIRRGPPEVRQEEHHLMGLPQGDPLPVIQWLAKRRLLVNSRECEVCHIPHVQGKEEWGGRLRMAMPNMRHSCYHQEGQLIHGSHLKLSQLLVILHEWSMDQPQEEIARVARINQTTTVVDWSNFCRDVCRHHFDLHENLIGGFNDDGTSKIVEIDESYFFKRKYNRGAVRPGLWVFGEIERGSKRCFLVEVPDRTQETLSALIVQKILPGNTIISDGWQAYNNIGRLGNGVYDHRVIIHEDNFVDPNDPDVHTQNIENTWMRAKRKLKRQFGTSEDLFPTYL